MNTDSETQRRGDAEISTAKVTNHTNDVRASRPDGQAGRLCYP